MPSAISEAGREIQPHQHLTEALGSGLRAPKAWARRWRCWARPL